MSSVEIPTLSGTDVTTHDYTIRVILEAQKWDLRLLYNDRADVWCITVTASGETIPVVANAPLWLGVNVLRYAQDTRLPGKLAAVSRGPADVETGLYELGRACALIYLELGEDGQRDVPQVPRQVA